MTFNIYGPQAARKKSLVPQTPLRHIETCLHDGDPEQCSWCKKLKDTLRSLAQALRRDRKIDPLSFVREEMGLVGRNMASSFPESPVHVKIFDRDIPLSIERMYIWEDSSKDLKIELTKASESVWETRIWNRNRLIYHATYKTLERARDESERIVKELKKAFSEVPD